MSKRRLQKYRELSAFEIEKRLKKSEAPVDNQPYVRKNEDWEVLNLEGGSPSVLPIIGQCAADISGYTEVVFDAYQGGAGVFNNWYELDIDYSLHPNTIFVLEDDGDWIGVQYNFLNVPYGEVVYYKYGNTYTGSDNPQYSEGNPYNMRINNQPVSGQEFEIPGSADYTISSGAILAFQQIADIDSFDQSGVLFSYYLDNFSHGFTVADHNNTSNGIERLDFGRKYRLITDGTIQFTGTSYKVKDPYVLAGITFTDVNFDVDANSRQPISGANDEARWIGRATAANQSYGDSLQFSGSATDLSLPAGNFYQTSAHRNRTAVRSAGINEASSGRAEIVPNGFTWTFPSPDFVMHPSSEVWNASASKILLTWEAFKSYQLVTIVNIV